MESGVRILTSSDLRVIGTTRLDSLGAVGQTSDGRRFRYSLAGAADLAPGKLAVNADDVANHVNRAPGADVAVGATTLTVAIGATAVVQDFYADGFLTVNAGSGAGITYKVVGNTASAGSTNITVLLAEPIQVALVASSDSKVSLKQNTWANILISDTDLADQPVGVPNVKITAANYGWVQTHGECSVLSDAGAAADGQAICASDDTAGAVGPLETDAVAPQIGIAQELLVSAEYRNVFLTID
jgi:hypothetical protein